jgi:hypothetical protein
MTELAGAEGVFAGLLILRLEISAGAAGFEEAILDERTAAPVFFLADERFGFIQHGSSCKQVASSFSSGRLRRGQ